MSRGRRAKRLDAAEFLYPSPLVVSCPGIHALWIEKFAKPRLHLPHEVARPIVLSKVDELLRVIGKIEQLWAVTDIVHILQVLLPEHEDSPRREGVVIFRQYGAVCRPAAYQFVE